MSMTETGLHPRPQMSLNLPIAARTVFVDLGTVRAALGVDAESVLAKVDAGELRWVFDIGIGTEKRELRFWARELIAPGLCEALNLDQALIQILNGGVTIRRGEIERQWVVSHVTVMRWIREGLVFQYAPGQIARESLARFLKERCVGADVTAKNKKP